MKQIPKEIYIALNRLEDHGYKAYLVGGAVRNLLLGKKIDDYDITTSAHPNAIKMIFNDYRQYKIGEKHGTIVVIIDNIKIDITTFRQEYEYKDYRHPSKVSFSTELYDDVRRRDFTINAICLDKDDNIIDCFDGTKDLDKKIIKAIGDPNTRFREDALRILRALRFSAKLNFKIEKNTEQALFDNSKLLRYIANERKKDEILQMFSYKNSYYLINKYLPIINEYIKIHKPNKNVNNFSNPFYVLAYCLKEDENNLAELKFSKAEINLINHLIWAKNIDVNNNYEFISVLSNEDEKTVYDFLYELYGKTIKDKYREFKKYIVNENSLKIDGQTLMKLGYQNKQIKEIKNELVALIRKQKLTNHKSIILNYLKKK